MRTSARATIRLTTLVTAFAALVVAAAPANADTVYWIRTATSPQTGQPVRGGGSWIVNKPNGYYLGRAMPNTYFNRAAGMDSWHYGRALDTVNMCGWVMPDALGGLSGGVSASSCDASTSVGTAREAMSHRRTFGKDFNAAAHDAVTGSYAPAVNDPNNCPLFYNYFYGTNFAGGANTGHWANQAPGNMKSGYVLYRYTTLDGWAVNVNDPTYGWAFTLIWCITRPTALYNDND
ncbi:MAG TPA: hypothetical protein VFQ85_07980 [Mycobacteriales bacterium]|jgi:hypothetical protein|nr:hypothetical protein [Mycobacteriales bacterium]